MHGRILACLLVFVTCCLGADNELIVPVKWQPSHPQNGQDVTVVVSLVTNPQEPFKDPLSGKDKYQYKAAIRKDEGNREEGTRLSVWVYLLTTNSLPSNAMLRIAGSLSVSKHQVKGGEYPATIDVRSWASFADVEMPPLAVTIDDALLIARKHLGENRVFMGKLTIASAVLHDDVKTEKAYWEIVLRKEGDGGKVTRLVLHVHMDKTVERVEPTSGP